MAQCLAGAALVWLAATSGAASARVLLDYTTVGEFSEPFSYYNCGIAVRGSAEMNVNASFGGSGIAVDGGNNGSFDGGETLTFQFLDDVAGEQVTATEVSYVASDAPGLSDGDAVSAELSIEAFGPGNVSLGVQAFSGTGEQSVSPAFGGMPIESFVMTASPDAVRIERIAYLPAPSTAITVQWPYGGAYQRAQIDLCGLTLSGSNTLSVGGLGAAGGGGVGVVGGVGGGQPDKTIDTGETLEVAFAEPATGVTYHRSSFFYVTVAGGDEFNLAAFGAGDVSLGSERLLTDASDIGVSQLFGGAPLSRFVIEASPGGTDGQQLGSVSLLVPEPGPAASGFAALASAAGLARLARHRRGASARRAGAADAVAPVAAAASGRDNLSTTGFRLDTPRLRSGRCRSRCGRATLRSRDPR